jgi:glycine/D-amino acid oxidase-like deaminating enzyme
MGEHTGRSILIAGAGPTGFALALELARRGFRRVWSQGPQGRQRSTTDALLN